MTRSTPALPSVLAPARGLAHALGPAHARGPVALLMAGLVAGIALAGAAGCPNADDANDGAAAAFVGGDGVFSPDFVRIAEGAAEGAFVITPYVNDTGDAGIRAFSEAFAARFGQEPDAWAALTYDAVGTFAEAMRRGGVDRKKVRDALAAMNDAASGYNGVTGVTFFDANGDCVKPAIVATVTGGKLVKAPVQLAEAPKDAPKPWRDGEGKATGEPIVIGVAGPFTGSAQKFGEMIRLGATLKVDEINAHGGVGGRPLEVRWGDDEGNNSKATNVANDFASDPKLVAVVGHFNSTCSLAGKPVYRENGIPAISPGSTNVEVCRGSDWMFRNLYRDDFQGQIVARFLKESLGKKKAVVFYDNDDYGTGLKKFFVEEAAKIGLVVAKEIPYNRESTTDFTPLVTNAKYERPDVIFVAGLYNEAALIVKACQKAGLTK